MSEMSKLVLDLEDHIGHAQALCDSIGIMGGFIDHDDHLRDILLRVNCDLGSELIKADKIYQAMRETVNAPDA